PPDRVHAPAGRGGRAPRPHRRRVRDRDHRGPHPARLRLPRHPQAHRAARMTPLLLVLLPALGAVLAAVWRSDASRPLLLPVFGLGHAVLACALLVDPPTV